MEVTIETNPRFTFVMNLNEIKIARDAFDLMLLRDSKIGATKEREMFLQFQQILIDYEERK